MIAGLDTLPAGRVTSVQTINRYVAQILTQWREGQAVGPLWFGRNRRAEAVILPGDLAHAVADAAVDGIDLEQSAELRLRSISPRLPADELAALCGAAVNDALLRGTCRAAADELAALHRGDPAIVAEVVRHLAQGSDQAVATRLSDVSRRVARTSTATWVSYWSSADGALLALVPAPAWLHRLAATGPQEPQHR
ncbi:MAG TPA: hypothetical protein VGL36_35435 [Kribbella sp.]